MSLPGVVLLACGSYSPPTSLHLRMFEIARDHIHHIGAHNIIGGIISPVHDKYSKMGLVSAKHRCEMVKLAVKSSDWIKISDWECQQDNWISTRQSIQYHQNYINNYVNNSMEIKEKRVNWLPNQLVNLEGGRVQVKLLCGADLLESFTVPGLWSEEDIKAILENHGLIVVSRNGTHPEKIIFENDLLAKYKKNIMLITNWVSNEVSSCVIRRLVNRGQSVKYLIDDGVIEYIAFHRLFETKMTGKDFTDFSTDMTTSMEYDLKKIKVCDKDKNGDVSSRSSGSSEDYAFSDFLKKAIKKNRLRIVRTEYCTV